MVGWKQWLAITHFIIMSALSPDLHHGIKLELSGAVC